MSDSSAHSAPRSLKVVVIGAGAFGSWTALHLLRLGADVTLVDAWGPGNSRSSSGGESRLIRAIYGPDRIYTKMVQRSFELFSALEEATGTRLYRRTGGLWMFSHDDSYIRGALPIVEELGFPVEQIDLDDATRRWPQVSFSGVESVYYEPQAGVLSARDACGVVADRFVGEGGTYLTANVGPEPPRDGILPLIHSSEGGLLQADHYVFCCGPWLGKIFPDVIGEVVLPSRQEVYYFGPPAGSTQFDRGQLPAWIDFSEGEVYGIPRTFGRGLKLADDSRDEPFDPTSGERIPSPEGIEQAREYIARRFPAMDGAPLVEARVCQYENSPDGDLIIDRHPDANNCWIVGGGSGHGFKLGPAVGEYVAQRILDGGDLEPKFRLERLGWMGKSTKEVD